MRRSVNYSGFVDIVATVNVSRPADVNKTRAAVPATRDQTGRGSLQDSPRTGAGNSAKPSA